MIEQDLGTRYVGCTSKAILIRIFDSAGDPLDMTGALIFAQFRRNNDHGQLWGDFSIGSGITWTNIGAGEAQIDQIDELNWAAGTYHYDIKVQESAGVEEMYAGGTMKVCKPVTKTP